MSVGTACRACGVDVISAVLADGSRVVLDEAPCEEGIYAAWLRREGLNWVHHCRLEGDRAGGRQLRRPHVCVPRDKQLELGGAA